jgi:AcrR family transcriptional regulator
MVTDGDVSLLWQRERILEAVVEVVAERGVAGASVGLVSARAKVSRHTFYECFAGLDECLVALLEGALARATPLVMEGFAGEGAWQDGMRAALAAMLEFFDREAVLVRVCLVEMLTAGPVVRGHRERVVAEFRALVIEQISGEVSHPSPLAPEGIHASLIGIVSARLIAPEPRAPLIELLGPLMGIIVGPFMEEAEVTQEVKRGNELAHELQQRRCSRAADDAGVRVRVPDVLLSARAHGARQCLLYVAEQGRRGLAPSNQQIADAVGLSHRAQVSRVLARLAALGLLVKRAGAPGYPNEWSLTPEGERVVLALAEE